jgi:hypothetical protein
MSKTKEDIREMWGLMHDDFKSRRTHNRIKTEETEVIFHETCDSS